MAATPKLLHVSFLAKSPAADRVARWRTSSAATTSSGLRDEDIYLHYPNGLPNATFMLNGFDRALGVTSTSRNWNTVVKLADMATTSA